MVNNLYGFMELWITTKNRECYLDKHSNSVEKKRNLPMLQK